MSNKTIAAFINLSTGPSQVLRVTSRHLGASLMLLMLAQLMVRPLLFFFPKRAG